MSINRAIPGLLLCVATACASHGSTSPAPKVKESPKAAVRVSYSGGLLDRSAQAYFRLDESAYTMVAHLGGDGQYEILYPTEAGDLGYVSAGKWFRTKSFAAYYDGVPSLYSFATTSYRTLGARMDSYDGLGNGFVFVLASRKPLRFDKISEFGLWYDMEAEDYRTSPDPRESIRKLAGALAGGNAYTLQFARDYNSTAFVTAADAAYDCAVLSSYANTLGALLVPYSFGSHAFTTNPGFSWASYNFGCPASRYALYDPYGSQRYFRVASTPTVTPRIPTPTNPSPSPSNPLHRPSWRDRDNRGRASANAYSAWNRRSDESRIANGSRIYNAPSRPRWPSFEPGFGTRYTPRDDGGSVARRDRPSYGGRQPSSGDFGPRAAPAERPTASPRHEAPREAAAPRQAAPASQGTTARPNPGEKQQQ